MLSSKNHFVIKVVISLYFLVFVSVISVGVAPKKCMSSNNGSSGEESGQVSSLLASSQNEASAAGLLSTPPAPNMQTSPVIPDRAIPNSFSTPCAAMGTNGSSNSGAALDKPPDANDHSDSGFRSEDGTGDSHHESSAAPFPPDAKHLENKLHALSVDK